LGGGAVSDFLGVGGGGFFFLSLSSCCCAKTSAGMAKSKSSKGHLAMTLFVELFNFIVVSSIFSPSPKTSTVSNQ
jgi:hypothetical protein